LIFKTAEKITDAKTGDISTVVQSAWNARKTQARTNAYQDRTALKSDVAGLKEVANINKELTLGTITHAEAEAGRAAAMNGCTDNAKRLAETMSANIVAESNLEEAQKKSVKNLGENRKQISDYAKEQRKQIISNQKAAESFKGLSNSMKAMGMNLGMAALVGLVINGISKLWNYLDDKHALTAETKISKMEEAVNNYNDALETSEGNIKNINSVADEFETLSKGVNASGENIGLSADQYARYNEIVSELVAINPDLVKGYTIEGNAIVDRNSAIEQGIKLQEEYAKNATLSYLAMGSDIQKGIQENLKDVRESMKEEGGKVRDAVGDAQETGHYYGRSGHRTGGEVSDIVTQAIGEEVDFETASLEQLREIAAQKEEIVAKAIEQNGWNRTDAEDAEKINELTTSLISLTTASAQYEAAAQPMVDYITTYVSQMTVLGEVAEDSADSILNSVPEALRSGYQASLKEIAMDASLTSSEMAAEAVVVADTLKKVYQGETVMGVSSEIKLEGSEELVSYREVIEEAEQAKEAFDETNGDKTAVEEYNDAVTSEVHALNTLADKWQEVDPIIAEALRSQANNIKDYAQENALSLEKAFNPLKDLMAEARNAKEEFDAAMEGGDYNTGINAFGEVYDEVMDGFDNAGNGTKAFWQAAQQMLGADTLKEMNYDFDEVNAKMKSLSGVMTDAKSGTAEFFSMLLENREELNNLIEDGKGGFKELIKSDGSYDIDSSEFKEVADALNISEPLLASMIDNARHWTEIDLSNTGEVETAIREMEGVWTDSEGTAYQFYDTISSEAAAAGLNVDEVHKKIANLDNVKVIDLTLFFDEETIGEVTKSLISMDSALGSEDGVGGFSVNADAVIERLLYMGRTAEETAEILEELDEKGWIKEGSHTNESDDWSSYTSTKETDVDVSNPTNRVVDGIMQVVSAIDQLTIAMGGIPTDINFETNAAEIQGDIVSLQAADTYTKEDVSAVKLNVENTLSTYEQLRKNARSSGNEELAKKCTENIKLLEEYSKTLDEMLTEASSKEEAILAEAESDFKNGNISESAYKKIQDGTLETVFGNIDMDDRPIIEWSEKTKEKFKDELISWGEDPELGSVSTVIGGSIGAMFGEEEVEIAYTPIIETDGKAELLGKETVGNYLQEVADAAMADGKWDLSEILEIDAKGLKVPKLNSKGEQVGTTYVQGIIAGVGEEQEYLASEIGYLMHYAGQYGASVLAGYSPLSFQIAPQITPQVDNTGETQTSASLNSLHSQALLLNGDYRIGVGVTGYFNAMAQLEALYQKKKQLAQGGTLGIGGSIAKGTNYRPHTHFPSMAKGGKLGPNGNGGLTLTGELGTELVWIPSESRSFLVGQFGPEMVNLPAEAVVYPADETRRIIGDTIPRHRFNFGTMAYGNTTFGSAGTGKPISTSSSSSTKTKEKTKGSVKKYESGLDKLQHQLEMGYITESRYYTKLKDLYDKHKKALKKNVEEQRAALEELRSAWIDAYESKKDSLDHKLEMGTITEAQYYEKLKALGKKYYKDRKGYTDEWKQHLEDQREAWIDSYDAAKDSLDHKLEMGTISEAQYYKKLKDLGDEYYKGRKKYADEWKEHLEERKDAANDAYNAEAEDLEDSLERGTLSVESYYKKITELQKKYLSGKTMAEDRADAKSDMFDNLRDGLDELWDKAQQKIDDNDLFGKWVKGGKTSLDILQDAYDKIEELSFKYFKTEKERLEYLKEKQREIAQARKEFYEDQRDNLQTILDLTEDMVRQEAQDVLDGLEKQKDAYSEIIEKKKKSLAIANVVD